MEVAVIGQTLLIIVARIADVSLGTLRTVFVVNGHRGIAWVLGFFEALIWVLVVARVMNNLSNPIYAAAYSFGFATGCYLGMTLERHLAFGDQIVRVFTHHGPRLAEAMRREGYKVAEFQARSADMPMSMLFVEVRRRHTLDAVAYAQGIDPTCSYVVDDVRLSSSAQFRGFEPTGWRAILKKK
jgi:uncharacterized protein YebE (UPF0316 family)